MHKNVLKRHFMQLTAQNVDKNKKDRNFYLELLRRGYQVYVGKNGDSEVDFIAIGENGEEYYQVCYSVREENTLKRELMPLDTISDHNPKYLLTMDDEPIMSHNGIKQIYVLDWLLNK